MSKQPTGIRENLHYHENSAGGNLNAGLPRLTYKLLLTKSLNVFPGARYVSATSEFSTVRSGSGPHLEANIRVVMMAFKGTEYKWLKHLKALNFDIWILAFRILAGKIATSPRILTAF